MKKNYIAIFILVAMLIITLCACTGNKISPELKMPTDSLSTPLDNSIPLMTGDMTKSLKGNIDRGYRLETYIYLGSGKGGLDNTDAKDYLDMMLEYYSPENIREIQVYVYLNEYKNKLLDSHALNQMKSYFEHIRSKNMSMLLRFAYEPVQLGNDAPTHEHMVNNIAILKKWIHSNLDLWYSTVTAYQIGMIGAWGEFGASNEKYDRKEIVNLVCDMVPDNTYIQGRYVDVTKMADDVYQEKVGYHNDFIVGRPHQWGTAGGNNDSKNYKIFEKTNKFRLNDGEMPWAGGSMEPDDYIDGKNFARQMYEHHMSTFSIEHNYKEWIYQQYGNGAKPGKVYNIARFREEMLSKQDVISMGVPYYDEYFKDSAGNEISHSIYDYVEDFLGYHLVLSSLKINGSDIEFMLTNFGFGAPLNIRYAELVLIDGAGNQECIQLTDYDEKTLTTYAQQIFRVKVPHSLDGYSIGVRFRRAGNYCIRTANNIPYADGINFIR